MPHGGHPVSRTIVLIHGAWVTPLSWQPFIGFFEERGYTCIAPAWPGKDRSVEAIRADPSPLIDLGIAEIVDHYERIIRELSEPPILIGHSFGGLFVQDPARPWTRLCGRGDRPGTAEGDLRVRAVSLSGPGVGALHLAWLAQGRALVLREFPLRLRPPALAR
jgi:pimeloyl-ACP methyl ester carboxylesterase